VVWCYCDYGVMQTVGQWQPLVENVPGILHGAVAIRSRFGGIFRPTGDFIADLPPSLAVKELWKLIGILQSYRGEYCYRRCSMVCLSVMVVTKMAELIEMPFGIWTGLRPRNHVLDGDPDPRGKGHFWGWKGSIGNTVHVRRRCGLLSNYFDQLLLLSLLSHSALVSQVCFRNDCLSVTLVLCQTQTVEWIASIASDAKKYYLVITHKA